MRWADCLLQYNFRVEHIPGRSNSVADMLSRHSAEGNCESSDDTGDTARLSTVFGNAQLEAITPKQLEEATRDDPLLCEASKFITSNWPAKCPTDQLKPLYNISNELSMCGGCVYRGERACIPKSLRTQVLQLAHEGHPGITRMKQRLRDTAWWPGIDAEVECYVKACTACIESNKSGPNLPTPPLQPIEYPSRPWQKIALDIVGELTGLPDHHRYLMVLVDLHSKWPEIRATSTITTSAVRVSRGLLQSLGIA